jgi:lysophospholipase L1-like esterase
MLLPGVPFFDLPIIPVAGFSLPAGTVLDLFIDKGRTVGGGVLTQWADPTVAHGVTLTVPGGFTGLAVTATGVQQYDAQINGTTSVGLSSTTATPFTAGQPRTVMTVGATNGFGTFATFMRTSTSSGTVSLFQLGNGYIYAGAGNVTAAPTPWAKALSIVSWKVTPGAGLKPIVRVNGWPVDPAVITGTADLDAGSAGVTLGYRSDFDGLGWNDRLEQVQGWSRILSSADDAAAEAYYVARFGLVGVSNWISDGAGISMLCSNVLARCPFAATRLHTSATSLALRAINTAGSASVDELTVFVDGVFNSTIAPAADSVIHATTLTLDGSPHTVEIWDGESNINLTSVNQTTGTVALVEMQDPTGSTSVLAAAIPSKRLVVYGDSITTGYAADHAYHGCFQLLRQDPASWTGRVSIFASGGRSLNTDFALDSTFGLLAGWTLGLANEVASGGTRILALCIGRNDWAGAGNNSPWANLAAFQAAYLAFLQKLRALDATVTIICQTPLVTSDETNNLQGFSLGDVRTAITTSAGSVSGVIVVQGNAAFAGKPAVSVGQLADGIHPNTAGQAAWKLWWKGVLAANGGP